MRAIKDQINSNKSVYVLVLVILANSIIVPNLTGVIRLTTPMLTECYLLGRHEFSSRGEGSIRQ